MGLCHVVDLEILYRHYVYISSDSRMITRHMHQLTGLCVQRIGISTGSLVVKLGSNIGSQLAVFRDTGMRADYLVSPKDRSAHTDA